MTKKVLLLLVAFSTFSFVQAQNVMTPELLWKLGRVGNVTLSPDGKSVYYTVRKFDVANSKSSSTLFAISINGGEANELATFDGAIGDFGITPDKKQLSYTYKGALWNADLMAKNPVKVSNDNQAVSSVKYAPKGDKIVFADEVKLDKTITDRYEDLTKANAKIYDDLMYRHWDSWSGESYTHPFIAGLNNGKLENATTELLAGEKFKSPTAPFGGAEDFAWNTDGTELYYVCKKKSGKEYALSTNTDIYIYNVNDKSTKNFTEFNKGYDNHPKFSPNGGQIVWLSMERDGYEADKNRLMLFDFKTNKRYDLTFDWDGTINDFTWSNDGQKIYAIAPYQGTQVILEVNIGKDVNKYSAPKNLKIITSGDYNYTSVQDAGNLLIATREDMNNASEIFSIDKKTGVIKQLTFINKANYEGIKKGKIEKRIVKTTDGKDMLVWVAYPPDFDPAKKYPTLLYCQGGPQSQVSQFYSYRWNFQLMAANGYIVVAPNRRGLPGFGQAWNEEISQDWGGQPIRDYLEAIDNVAMEDYVDKSKVGAVGASYGGYSVYMLAGVHNGRFKSFISHCGLFNLESWYGTTEELFFANWDIGGPYWDNKMPDSYGKHSPHKFVYNWDTPIMVIHGGNDFRVPDTQGLEAYQAAQLKGIKSRLLYFPDEGHWVLKPHNAMLWHREFFRWLKETL